MRFEVVFPGAEKRGPWEGRRLKMRRRTGCGGVGDIIEAIRIRQGWMRAEREKE